MESFVNKVCIVTYIAKRCEIRSVAVIGLTCRIVANFNRTCETNLVESQIKSEKARAKSIFQSTIISNSPLLDANPLYISSYITSSKRFWQRLSRGVSIPLTSHPCALYNGLCALSPTKESLLSEISVNDTRNDKTGLNSSWLDCLSHHADYTEEHIFVNC